MNERSASVIVSGSPLGGAADRPMDGRLLGPVSPDEFVDVLVHFHHRGGDAAFWIGHLHEPQWWTPRDLTELNMAIEELERRYRSPIGSVPDRHFALGVVIRFVNSQLCSGC